MALPDSIYQHSPVWGQTLLLNAYALRVQRERYGPAFRRLRAQWAHSQWWEPGRMREWQDTSLREIVRMAVARVPLYGRMYAEHGVNTSQIQGVDDLPRLPVLTKDQVRAAGSALLAPDVRDKLVHGHTSGTTGSPLGLWYDRAMCVANNVADWRQKTWGGMDLRDWCGLFLGRVVVPPPQQRPPFWRVNYLHRQVWFSAFHLSAERLDLYLAEIRRRRLRFLEGYPSTMYILARHVLRRGPRLPLTAVFTSSETLHAIQRDALTAAFQCPVYDFYGLAERVVFAGTCPDGSKHLFDEYGVTEFVDDDGQPVPVGQRGWVTGTSLWNRGMPLIRYRTSDLSGEDPPGCTCGRHSRVMGSVTTKAEDIVVTPDGRYVSPSILTHPFKPFDQLLKSQIVQYTPDHLLVRLVPSGDFTDAHRRQLVAGLLERLGPGVRIETELVPDIPPERSGKFRWVISHVEHGCAVEWEA